MKTKQLVQNTLSQDAFYQVNKKIFRDLKNLNASFLITSLISKYSYFENRGELKEDNSFFNTKEMLTEELFLDEKAILKAENLLEYKGYIKTYSKGMPKKKHFIIDFNHIAFILAGGNSNDDLEKNKKQTDKRYKENKTANTILSATAKSSGTEPANLAVRNRPIYSGNDNKLITIKDNNNKGNDEEMLNTLDIEVTTEKSNNRIYNFIKPENYNSKGEDLIKKLQIEGGFETEISEIRELIAKDKFGETEYQYYFYLIW